MLTLFAGLNARVSALLAASSILLGRAATMSSNPGDRVAALSEAIAELSSDLESGAVSAAMESTLARAAHFLDTYAIVSNVQKIYQHAGVSVALFCGLSVSLAIRPACPMWGSRGRAHPGSSASARVNDAKHLCDGFTHRIEETDDGYAGRDRFEAGVVERQEVVTRQCRGCSAAPPCTDSIDRTSASHGES